MTVLKIVSLNAWGGQCWDALSSWLPNLGADVLCLQEVTRAPQPSPDWLRYVDPNRELEQRADLYRDVSALLPSYLPRFAAAARGYLSDSDGRAVLSEHGIAQWAAPHLALNAAWQGFVHGSFRPDGWGDEPVPRAGQVARFATASGSPFVIGHLHGLRDPSGKGDTPARRAQWLAMAESTVRVAAPGDPMILAGDLNVLPGSAAFEIFGRIGLTDLVTTRGEAVWKRAISDVFLCLFVLAGKFR